MGSGESEKRYQLHMRSQGEPIEVFLVSRHGEVDDDSTVTAAAAMAAATAMTAPTAADQLGQGSEDRLVDGTKAEEERKEAMHDVVRSHTASTNSHNNSSSSSQPHTTSTHTTSSSPSSITTAPSPTAPTTPFRPSRSSTSTSSPSLYLSSPSKAAAVVKLESDSSHMGLSAVEGTHDYLFGLGGEAGAAERLLC